MTKEEFLKNLKTAIEHSDVPMRDSLLETFYIYHPEFRESEDERKRKSLIKFLTDIKEISESGRTTWAVRKEDAAKCKSFIAYLEKQKDANKAIAAVDAIDTYIDQKECVEDETMAEKETVGDTPKKFINGEKKAKFRAGQYIKYKGHIYEITKVEIGITGPFYTVRIVDEEHDFEGTVTGIGVGGEPDMEEVERVKPFRWEPIDEDIDYVSKDYSGWLLTSDTLYHDGYKIRLYDLETRIKKK